MNIFENITCWYTGREKKPVIKHNKSVDDLQKKDLEYTKSFYKNNNYCACCEILLDNEDIEKKQIAQIKKKIYNFCSQECYLEWLDNPMNIWFSYHYSKPIDEEDNDNKI